MLSKSLLCNSIRFREVLTHDRENSATSGPFLAFILVRVYCRRQLRVVACIVLSLFEKCLWFIFVDVAVSNFCVLAFVFYALSLDHFGCFQQTYPAH